MKSGRIGPLLALTVVSTLLAGCERGMTTHYAVQEDSGVKIDLTKLAPPPASGAGRTSGSPVPVTAIAYTYSYSLETPASAIAPLMRRHQAACTAAGPAVCQLLDSNLSISGPQSMGTLNLRAAPDWLARFRAGLESDAHAAGGRIAQSATSAEDLTRSIVDTQASVRAQTTLRDRLQALLASRPGKLTDLLDLEKELARVQGGLDATTSELTELNGRVQMSKLTLSYAPPAEARETATTPLPRAIANFGALVAASLAAMVTLVGLILPWAFLAAAVGGGWVMLRRRKRLSIPKAPESALPPLNTRRS